MNPDPVRNLGPWSFTIQQETPVHWLRSGPLESYLLKCEVECNQVDGALVSTGVLLHSGDDVLGGGSVWMEVKDGRKVYCLGGNDLASKPLVTQSYPVHSVVRNGRNVLIEEWEFLLQGYTGCAFFDQRRVRIKFSLKRGKGAIAFFNSSKSPVWENPEAFDQLFSGLDVVFRNIRLTVVSKKVELDTFLKDPQVKVTEPQKKVKELWNESELDTKRKRAERRAQLTADDDGKKGPPEVGDVGPEHLGEGNIGNIVELEEKLKEDVVYSQAQTLGSSLAEQRRQKATQKMNLLQRQKELVENMGESVLFSSASSGSKPNYGKKKPTTLTSAMRAHILTNDELTADRQHYDDEWFRKSSDFGLLGQQYEFGLPPELEKPPPGQHIRNRDKGFNKPGPPSQKDVDKWRETKQEMRAKPALTEIPESELLGVRRRLMVYLDTCSDRISRTREELTALAAKRMLAEEKHPRTVQQQLMSQQMELEQKLSKVLTRLFEIIRGFRILIRFRVYFTERSALSRVLNFFLQKILALLEIRTSERRFLSWKNCGKWIWNCRTCAWINHQCGTSCHQCYKKCSTRTKPA
ncbi:unnamed protein product [Amoebophrya sp. A120]|nr:unnamed protein product [Amoebophrya sp. A120]|eukprot:GSA120T00012785001.1